MGSKWRVLKYAVLLAAVGLTACDDSGETDNSGGSMGMGGTPMGGTPMGGTPMGGTPMGGTPMGDTISFSAVASEWVTAIPGAEFNVCHHGTDNCVMTAEDGSFTLAGLPTDSEILVTLDRESDNARIAYPIATGTEDIVAANVLPVVSRGMADIMLAFTGEPGVIDTKSILTFYAGVDGFPQGRGIPGIEVTYDGPDTEKPAYFIVPTAESPGVTVGGVEVTSTTLAGNGFVPNIAPGDYTITFPQENRSCTPLYAWPGAEGSPANTFRTRLLEGYATFAFVTCRTDDTVTMTGTITDFLADGPLADMECCLNWNWNADGTFDDTLCVQSDEDGSVTHPEVPGDSRVLGELSKEGYMSALGTFETLTEDIDWAAPAFPEVAVITAAAVAGVVVDEMKGHIAFAVFNQEGQSLDGYTLAVQDGDHAPLYIAGGAFDTEATTTSSSGGAAFLNLDPGNYTFTVTKEASDVLCVPGPYSWSGGGYAAPIRANTITQAAVVCIDTPSALFGEPEEPIDAPSCSDDGEAVDNCAEACRHFSACASALCPGLQDLNEWEQAINPGGMTSACMDACTEAPLLAETVCGFSTCNETLTLAVTSQSGFEDYCDSGLDTLLETVVAAAGAPDSTITQAAALAGASEVAMGILGGPDTLTVFLPIDAAFEALAPETLTLLTEQPAERDAVLSYHVVPGGIPAQAALDAIAGGQNFLPTLGGLISLGLSEEGTVMVGGANVVGTDLFASNGVVHFIDGVIFPPEPLFEEPAMPVDAPQCVDDDNAVSCGSICTQFSECSQALCPGLQEISPWEEGFAATGMYQGCMEACLETPVLQQIACRHTTCNETLALAYLTQDGFGEFCDNGFSSILETLDENSGEGSNMNTAVELINESPNALNVLDGEGPMTLFLPIDSAFAALNESDMDAFMLLQNDPDFRELVLEKHIVVNQPLDSGIFLSNVDAANLCPEPSPPFGCDDDGNPTIPTLGGDVPFGWNPEGDMLIVGGANVVGPDIYTSNGVIHLIDGIISPN